MSALAPFIVIGLVTGAVYGLAATGLVLTFKTSGLFNFAHGSIATVAAYAFYAMATSSGMPWQAAFVLSVFVLGPVLGVLLELLARRLADVRTIYRIVAPVGLVMLVQAGLTLKYGTIPLVVNAYLPTGKAFSIGGTIVGKDQLIITVISVMCMAGLWAFLRFTPLGLAMRAVVDNIELLELTGRSPARIRRYAWMIGSSFACLAGVLLAPSLGLDTMVLTLLVVQAFGAAALGFFSNLPATFAGGVVVGLTSSILTKYAATSSNPLIFGLPASVPFLVLLVVLVLTPARKLVDRRLSARGAITPQWRAPVRVQATGALVLGAVLLALPFIVSDARMTSYTDGLTKVILFLSLGLLVRTSGQVSLAHAALAAIGACAFSHLAVGLGLPWLVAVLLAGLIAVPVGALIALPATRLSGVFLALATFGFGIAMEQMGYPLHIMFGTGGNGLEAPRPSIWGLDTDRGYYYLVLAFVILACVSVVLLLRSRLGRLLRGLGDSPTALTMHGASVNTTRILVFCLSAFMAAIYGALYGGVVSSVTSNSFTSFSSLTLVAVLALAAGGEPWFAFVAAAALVIPGAYISNANVSNWANMVFGLSAVAVSVNGGHPALPRRWRELIDRLGGRPADEPRTTADPQVGGDVRPLRPVPAKVTSAPDGAVQTRSGLEVRDLEVRFGGHVAVNGLSFSAPVGSITGLIGPNGAGKSTTINACGGLVRRTRGTVRLHGRDITSAAPAARARLGLGRTFQRMELFDSLTVRDNIVLGREAAMAGANPLRHLSASPGDRSTVDRAVREAVELCGIADWLDRPVGALSTGQRRLVELARTLAGDFDMLLLDEPSSGLNRAETERFGSVLSRVVAERGVGALMVEHDMELVMSVCSHIYVLDFGVPLFEGTPDEVMASHEVRAAYLGSDTGVDPAAEAIV